MIDLRHLRYFLAVAEHGSIAEAARRLHVAQPALSRQMRELEGQLGSALFERGVRGISLTTAGTQFLSDSKAILADLRTATERVSRVAEGMEGALRVGIAANYSWHPTILDSLRRFAADAPKVAVMLEPTLSARQIARIVQHELDGGFLTWRYLPHDKTDIEGLTEIQLFECHLKLALPRGSHLATAIPKKLSALREEPCMWFPRETAPAYDDFLTYQCQRAGFSPKKVQIGSDVLTILGMVAAGMGYSIVSDVSIHTCPKDVVLVDHPELDMTHPVSFVYRTNDSNPALRRLVECLKKG
ncbi:LysR family transcriptional regulator [Chitinasiproducens palmae]|uniref:DNA-binding transcriptional regulator, LysR family n=1 Tax=Chitinasiproducens palmae TaxID=1770053 RepID=A0A1H2PL48_9BURK|nr:LysR substrate-binding domain-containing protein [Chitinasiproducens palmae]SDV47191.1 DNA-binding transcriptional regulator, LysR family [Chitinasiproducens palmae]